MLTVLVFAVILLLLSKVGVDGVKIKGEYLEKDGIAVKFKYYWKLNDNDIMVKSEDGVPYVANSKANDIKMNWIYECYPETVPNVNDKNRNISIFQTPNGDVHIRGQGNDPKGRCEAVLDQPCCLRSKCANLVTQAFVHHGSLYFFMNRCFDRQQHLVYRIELSVAVLASLKQHVCSGEIERNELDTSASAQPDTAAQPASAQPGPAPPVAPAAAAKKEKGKEKVPEASASARPSAEKKKEKIPEASASSRPAPAQVPVPMAMPEPEPYMGMVYDPTAHDYGMHQPNYGMHQPNYDEWTQLPQGPDCRQDDNNSCTQQ